MALIWIRSIVKYFNSNFFTRRGEIAVDSYMEVYLKKTRKSRVRRSWWRRAVRLMACTVVFCTVYVLILPAITQERDTFCGIEGHTHGDACYRTSELIQGDLVCQLEEIEAHTHAEECYLPIHSHNETCYGLSDPTLICGFEEIQPHSHDEACLGTENVLICGLEEYQGHNHYDDCYSKTVTVQVCELEETEDHPHDESCFITTGGELTCEQTETPGHVHTEDCWTEVEAYICGLAETEGHNHTDVCYSEPEEIITCTLGEREVAELTCQQAETEGHIHIEACYQWTEEEIEPVLNCETEEHTHILSCYSDPTADLETASDWEATLTDVELTGIWSQDVLAIARSQIGYRESTKNYQVLEDGETIHGYTRYGQWYGIPYGNWCAMFVSFCLHYADVEDMPLDSVCANWITALSEVGLYRPADEYVPQPGDLVFFDWDADGLSNHVGLVAELEDHQITTIEGNYSDRVKENTYDLDDQKILGYAAMPNPEGKVRSNLMVQIYTDGTFQQLSDDDIVITVSGILPTDAEVRAFPVEIAQDDLDVLRVYEIEIFLSDGTVYQHGGEPLVVEFDLKGMDELPGGLIEPEVYYIPNEGEPEQMDTVVADGSVSFETPHFSTYALVKPSNVTQVATQEQLQQAITNKAAYIQLANSLTVNVTEPLVIDYDVTIDLYGQTLTHIGSVSLFSVKAGSLAIGDSIGVTEKVDDGTPVTVNSLGAHVATAAEANGKVTLEYYVTESKVINTSTGDTEETLYKHTLSSKGTILAYAPGQPLFTVTGGTLTVDSGMYYGGTGRAIYQTGGTTNLNGGYICGFTKNTAQNLEVWGYDNVRTDFGGAIWTDNATVNLAGAVLAGNEAPSGGAIYVEDSTVHITDGVISGNISATTGINVKNSEWLNHYGGGGIFALKGTTITMSGGYITNNRADSTGYFDGGGGILLCESNGDSAMSAMNVSGGYLTGNEAASGGAIRTNWAHTVRVDITGGYFCANYGRSAEGGAISINQGATAVITGGHYNNNRTDNKTHWGGGAIFGANGSKVYMLNVLATDNSAGGFGGGVAGCSTGRVQILVEQGGAVYANSAAGQNVSGSGTDKLEDRVYAYNDPVFMSNGYEDFFCALNSTVEGSMLGGGSANWQGSSDGKPVIVPADEILQSAYVAGLTSNPTAESIATAQGLANVYINGNYSNTHGGGILANGYLVIGKSNDFTLSSRIELTGSKALVNDAGEYLTTDEGVFRFIMTDAYTGEVIANGTNEEDGTIIFNRRLPFNEPGTYTYLIREVPQDNVTITYDTTVYRMTVTVKTREDLFYDGFNNSDTITRYWHQVTNVLLEKANDDEWIVVSETQPGNKEDGPIQITLTGSATFTNLLLQYTDITAMKKWEGTVPNTSVTVKLYRNGELHDTKVLNEDNNWRYTWENLPIYNKDEEGNIFKEYSYSVEEEHVDGYYSDYEIKNDIQLEEYWIPISYVSDSLVVGDRYLIVYQDSTGVNRVLNIVAPENQWITSADTSTAEWGDSYITYGGKKITAYFPMSEIDERSIFRAMEEDETHDKKSGIKLYNMGAANALLIENSNGNYLKVPSYWGRDAGWVSLFTYDGTKLYGHYQGTENGTYTIIYEEAAGKFDADPQEVLHGIAQLYTLVTAGSASETVVTITNRPVEQLTYELNITKVSAWDSSVRLAGAEFSLSDSDGNVLTFLKEAEGSYVRSDAEGASTVLVTNSGGKLVLKDLLAGEYSLKETKAPSGYLPVEEQTVTLGGDDFEGLTLELTVADMPNGAYVLPETGGAGTTSYTMAGLLLMLLSTAFLLYINRKRGREGA